MKLESAFDTLITAWYSVSQKKYPAANYLDLTLLDPAATIEQIQQLEISGKEYGTAALCILPEHLPWLKKNTGQALATVINFPAGTASLDEIFKILDVINETGVQEIDYVFPWKDYLDGNTSQAVDHCRKVVNRIHNLGMIAKVIMETGAFPDFGTLFTASLNVLDTGCNFLKTSTGKIQTGATPAAATALLSAIQNSGSPCGIKFSGGIKTREQAYRYLNLAELFMEKEADSSWLRIGASVAGAREIMSNDSSCITEKP